MDNTLTNQLLYNAIQTPDGTILHSKHRHDFVCHIDANGKKYCIDGGLDYRRIVGDTNDIKDMCVYDDGKWETRRKYLCWERKYDENMNQLPETEWIPIKDLKTSHIKNILKNVKEIPSIYLTTFKQELIHRTN